MKKLGDLEVCYRIKYKLLYRKHYSKLLQQNKTKKMAEEKFIFEGIVEELQRVERIKDGGRTEVFKAKIQARGDESDQVIRIQSSEQIGLVEGEVVQIVAKQVQRTLDEVTGPDVN